MDLSHIWDIDWTFGYSARAQFYMEVSTLCGEVERSLEMKFDATFTKLLWHWLKKLIFTSAYGRKNT